MKNLTQEFQRALELARVGFARLSTDGCFEAANDFYLNMLDRSASSLIGASWRVTVHPGDHVRAEDAYQFARRNGSAYVELRGLRSNGTIIYQALTIISRYTDGEFTGYYCIRFDITRYKADQEALALAVESSPNGLVILDPARRVQLVNAAVERMFGYSREELIGRPVEILIPQKGEHRGRILGEVSNRDATGGSASQRDVRGLRKDGEDIPLEVFLNTIDTPSGTLVLMTIVDIAERLRYQNQLEAAKQVAESANRAKSDFLARMSHEIRTPMNLIMGMNATLLEGDLTPKQREYVQISYRNVRRLLKLINGILDLSKVEAGKIAMDAEPFNLFDVLEECAATINAAMERKGLEFSIHVTPGTWPHWIGDAERLEQVLLNLLGNAVKFTSEGSIRIHVQAAEIREGREGLQFSVSDTGIGVAAEKRSAIFEPFEQADASINRRHEGTGLGLSIAQSMVRMMGGDLWLAESGGKGSTFVFNVCLTRATAEVADHAAGARGTQAAERIPAGTRILLADDNPENVLLLRIYLDGLPVTIDVAKNGEEALTLFHSNTYHVILMDIQMPIMDGYTATKLIRLLENVGQRAPTPIIALTAHAIEGATERSLAAGCDAHLTKPIERDDLVKAIASILNLPAKEAPSTTISQSIAKLRPSFLAGRRTDLDRLRELVEAHDFPAVETIGHNCKGTGRSYGFPDISASGAKIEMAAKAYDEQRVRQGIEELNEAVQAGLLSLGAASTQPLGGPEGAR